MQDQVYCFNVFPFFKEEKVLPGFEIVHLMGLLNSNATVMHAMLEC